MNWRGALLAAAGGHVALLGAASVAASISHVEAPDLELMSGGDGAVEIVNVVRLSAGSPTRPTAVAAEPPAAPEPPRPEPRPQPRTVISLAPEPQPKPPAPEPEPRPVPLPTRASVIESEATETVARPTESVTHALVQASSTSPGGGGSAGPSDAQQTAGRPGPKGAGKPLSKKAQRAQQRYLGELMAWLAEHRVYPDELKKKKTEGTVKVRFSFEKSGIVTAVSIAESSSSAALDAAALDVLWRANPLPPIPDILERDHLSITLPIEYSLITE